MVDVYPQLEPVSDDLRDIHPRLFYLESGYGPPWYAAAGVVAGGLVLGLWHRGWRIARIWRMLILAAGVAYVAPLTPIALPATEAGFGIALVAPWLAVRRRL